MLDELKEREGYLRTIATDLEDPVTGPIPPL
jgi:hypothetical protein